MKAYIVPCFMALMRCITNVAFHSGDAFQMAAFFHLTGAFVIWRVRGIVQLSVLCCFQMGSVRHRL